MSMLRMRKRRLVPYVDPLAREVSNPHPTIAGFYIWQDVDDHDVPPAENATAEREPADADA
jgi:hypothetical protein